jgi:hypothetical protein
MKHTPLKISLLACSLLLGACTSSFSSNASSSAATSSSATTSAVSSSSSPAESSDIRSSYGAFQIEATTNGATPVFDSATSTYTLAVSAKKATYTATGYLKGRIVVANPDNLTSYKGVVLILNGVYLESDSETDYAIDDTNSDKYLALETSSGTTNYVVANAGAIHSENNLRFGGDGTLNVVSKTGHGAKADDILFYGAGNVVIQASADGLHGKNFYTNDSETTPTEFTGTLTIQGVQEQALDFSDGSGTTDDPWVGSILVDKDAKIVIKTAQNVARANTAITVNGSIIATGIIDTSPIITKNTGALVVTVASDATFTVNGTALASQIL